MKPTQPHGTLEYEFPEFDASTLPAIPDGFQAAHWHNDICPHWERGNLALWIDFADAAQREFAEGKRFTLHWMIDPKEHSETWILECTDDWAQILTALENVEARKIGAKWVARFQLGFHPDTRGKDYVFPNEQRCLTEAEAAEYDADIHQLFGLDCDPYEQGLAAMRAAGLIGEDEA